MKVVLALIMVAVSLGAGYLMFETYGNRFGLKSGCGGVEGGGRRECNCQGWMKKGDEMDICYGFCGECKCFDRMGVEKECE